LIRHQVLTLDAIASSVKHLTGSSVELDEFVKVLLGDAEADILSCSTRFPVKVALIASKNAVSLLNDTSLFFFSSFTVSSADLSSPGSRGAT